METSDLCMGCMAARGATEVCPECGWDEDDRSESPLVLAPRTVLHDQYLLGRVLGHGGFGITYLAWDLNLATKLAVKEYLPRDLAGRYSDGVKVTPYRGQSREHFEFGLKRFLEEARTLAKFSRPDIVRVLNFFRENETGYLVMEYVPGESFETYLREHGGRVPFDLALQILMPVMDALAAVHDVGLLHRDIAPDNIYLSYTGHVKLLDFGAVKNAIGEHSKSLDVVIKRGYAPWEQYQARGRLGPWTDEYALAATLYRAIAGCTPPEAGERLESDELEPPSLLGVPITGHQEAVLMKALSVRASERFQSVREFQDALQSSESFVVPGPEPAPVPPLPKREEEVPRPVPRPEPTPQPVPVGLENVIVALTPVAERIGHLVRKGPGHLAPPAEIDPAQHQFAIGLTGVVGVLGVLQSLSLVGAPAAAQWAGAVAGMGIAAPLLQIAGLLGCAVLTLGAWLCYRGDARGPIIAWASAWTLGALTVIGFSLFWLMMSNSMYWAAVPGNVRWMMIGPALTDFGIRLGVLGFVIFMFSKGKAAPGS